MYCRENKCVYVYAGGIKGDYVVCTDCLRVSWKKIYSCNNQYINGLL